MVGTARERLRRRAAAAFTTALLIAVTSIGPAVADPPTAAAVTSTPWITVLCKFQDIGDEPKAPAYFDSLMGSTYPGMDHYWRQVSYGNIDLAGSRTTSRWFTLPRPRSAYQPATAGAPWEAAKIRQLFDDCTAAANPDVDFRDFFGINLMFNADRSDGLFLTKGTDAERATLDGATRTWAVTWLSRSRFVQQAALAHEMGHGYGLPHTSTAAVGGGTGNRWDLMSTPACTFHLVFDCVGPHPIAFHKMRKGWLPAGRIFTPPGNLGTWRITLDDLASQSASNPQMVRIPHPTLSQRYWTVEARLGQGDYENALGRPAAAIVHEVDLARDAPALVIDADNNGNTLDAGARLTAGETFAVPGGHRTVRVESRVATGMVVVIDMRVPPENVRRAGATPSGIRIRWDDRTIGEASFQIEWQAHGATTWRRRTAGANVTSATIGGLQELTRYQFRVRACDATGVCSGWAVSPYIRTPAEEHRPCGPRPHPRGCPEPGSAAP